MTHILHKAATGALLGLSFIVVSSDAAFAKPKPDTTTTTTPATTTVDAAPTCSISDITVLLTGAAAPISCLGSFDGNNSNSATKATLFGSNLSDTQKYGNEFKLDAAAGTSAENWFKIDENATQNGGTLTFLKDVNSLFSFVLKSSTNYSSYIFDGVTAGKQFSFTNAGTATNKQGVVQRLSHASLYISDKPATPTTPIPVPPIPNTTPTEIPEPSTALGLLAFGAVVKMARRRQVK
jgi:hypothetical protein